MLGGGEFGVGITADSNNTIGGAIAGARNVISGNGTEIRMQADNNVIQGNYIGISATGGAFNYSNTTITGVFIFSSTGNTVGGTTPEALVQKAIAWFLAVHRYGVDGAKR